MLAQMEVEIDRFDDAEPPMSPESSISLYFPHGEWSRHNGSYTADFRPEANPGGVSGTWGHVFCFDVAKNYVDDDGDRCATSFLIPKSKVDIEKRGAAFYEWATW